MDDSANQPVSTRLAVALQCMSCQKGRPSGSKSISQSAATARSHHMVFLRHTRFLLAHVWVSGAVVMVVMGSRSFGSGNPGTHLRLRSAESPHTRNHTSKLGSARQPEALTIPQTRAVVLRGYIHTYSIARYACRDHVRIAGTGCYHAEMNPRRRGTRDNAVIGWTINIRASRPCAPKAGGCQLSARPMQKPRGRRRCQWMSVE